MEREHVMRKCCENCRFWVQGDQAPTKERVINNEGRISIDAKTAADELDAAIKKEGAL